MRIGVRSHTHAILIIYSASWLDVRLRLRDEGVLAYLIVAGVSRIRKDGGDFVWRVHTAYLRDTCCHGHTHIFFVYSDDTRRITSLELRRLIARECCKGECPVWSSRHIRHTHTYIYIASISLSILYPLSSRMLPRRRHMYAYAYLTAIFTPSFSFEQKKPSFHECPSPVETYQGHNEPDSTDMRVSTYQSPWTRFCLVVFTARWWCCFWFPKNLNG